MKVNHKEEKRLTSECSHNLHLKLCQHLQLDLDNVCTCIFVTVCLHSICLLTVGALQSKGVLHVSQVVIDVMHIGRLYVGSETLSVLIAAQCLLLSLRFQFFVRYGQAAIHLCSTNQ